MTAEHHSRICFAFGQVDFDEQHKVGVLLFRDQKELFVGRQSNFVVRDFCSAIMKGSGIWRFPWFSEVRFATIGGYPICKVDIA